jgi:hypothetical protein
MKQDGSITQRDQYSSLTPEKYDESVIYLQTLKIGELYSYVILLNTVVIMIVMNINSSNRYS